MGRNVQDLLQLSSWEGIWEVIARIYPDSSEEGYRLVWTDLTSRKGIKTSKTCSIDIEELEDDFDGTKYWSVGMDDTKEPGKHYSLSFMRWDIVLGLKADNLPDLPIEDIIAHILWEITYYGFTEKQMESHGKDVMGAMEKAQKQMKEDGLL